MHTALFVISALLLFPASSGFAAEFTDTPPTLTVSLDPNPPFVFKDDEGHTVVLGQVFNNDEMAFVTSVHVSANFYDATGSQLLESNINTTVMDVIPPSGSSPYMIRSPTADAAIDRVSVHLEGFDPSRPKMNHLEIQGHNLSNVNDTLYFSGVLENAGAPATDAVVHVAVYDNFDPPRLVGVHVIPLGELPASESVSFDFNEMIHPQAAEFAIFSESDISYSDSAVLDIPAPDVLTKLVTIKDVIVMADDGVRLTEIPFGTTVHIQGNSQIQFATDQSAAETPYTYYVQVKRLGSVPYVEYLGKYDGSYAGTADQSPFIEWLPENRGLFSIESYVWDWYGVPISHPGPLILINVK